MNELLGPTLHALGHFIQDVGCFVHPATLLGHRSVFFTQCEPEAKRAITNRQFWSRLETLSFELLEHFAPRLGALPLAVNDGQQLLGAVRQCAD